MIESVDPWEAEQFIKNTELRNRVGQALSRAYPTTRWGVNAVDGIVQITCADLSDEWGMVIHADRTTMDIETQAVRSGGEMLERFRVDRTFSDFSHLDKNARGQVINASKGEQ